MFVKSTHFKQVCQLLLSLIVASLLIVCFSSSLPSVLSIVCLAHPGVSSLLTIILILAYFFRLSQFTVLFSLSLVVVLP